MSEDDRTALIEMERMLLGYCEMPQLRAIILRITRILLKQANASVKDGEEVDRLHGEIESWKALVKELESKLANHP